MYTALESQCVAELKAVRHQIVMARQRGQCRDREWAETIDKITSLVDGAADLARESEINEREMWGRARAPSEVARITPWASPGGDKKSQ